MPVVAYEEELNQIDYRKSALSIGIHIPGEERPWMEFDAEELKVLHLLLTKPLIDGESAASEYPMLRMLAAWAKAAGKVAQEVEAPEHSRHG